MNLGPYAKALNGTVVALLGSVIIALENGNISPVEIWGIVGTTLAASIAIWGVRNGGRLGTYAKAITAALVPAVGNIATGYLDGFGLSTVEILGAVVLLLNGLIVGQTPNAQESDDLMVHDLTEVDEQHEDLQDGPPSEDDPAVPRRHILYEDDPTLF